MVVGVSPRTEHAFTSAVSLTTGRIAPMSFLDNLAVATPGVIYECVACPTDLGRIAAVHKSTISKLRSTTTIEQQYDYCGPNNTHSKPHFWPDSLKVLS